ncbi:MAG: IS200/IS605 family transposase [Candidatus Anammoxibacter sp.]
MAQSLAKVYLHIVFSTKNRIPFLNDDKLRKETHSYLAGTCKNLDSPSLLTGGTKDHIHILCVLSRKHTIADLVRDLKRESSKWIKTKKIQSLGDFHWQQGYGAFSIAPSHIEPLKKYIVNQETHHQEETFQDEFRRLLRKYNIECNEQYVWD